MAALSEAQRDAVWKQFMEEGSDDGDGYSIEKDALRDMVADTDDWADGGFLGSYPQAVVAAQTRLALTDKQITQNLTFVMTKRYAEGVY